MKYLVGKKFGTIDKWTVIERIPQTYVYTDWKRIIAHAKIRDDKDFTKLP